MNNFFFISYSWINMVTTKPAPLILDTFKIKGEKVTVMSTFGKLDFLFQRQTQMVLYVTASHLYRYNCWSLCNSAWVLKRRRCSMFHQC
jgi:hypothetical protein